MRRLILFFILFTGLFTVSYAQDNLMAMLDSNDAAPIKIKKEAVTATFKATRIIDGSSVQNLGAGVLDFRISHRFGDMNQGTTNFFGLDNATTRLGLDYGITKWLMVGIAHNTFDKENDGFLKWRILQQRKRGTPITLSYVGAISIQTTPAPTLPAGDTWLYTNRMYYAHQLLIARKFNERLSLQLMPTIIHYNLVDSDKFSNNTIAIGVGGRIKVSKRIAITGEYYYRATNADMLVNGQTTHNALSIGVDIETGGHVFQLMLTNAQGMTERTYIGQTIDSWSNGGLHFGFNISRVFTIVKPREFKNSGW
jgi:opacity protein-like surface antigen